MSGHGMNGTYPPAVDALLNAVMDRVEAKPFAQRSRAIHFSLTAATWPAFFDIEHPAERHFVWRALEALGTKPGFGLRLDQRRGYRDLDIWQRSPALVISAEAECFLREATGRKPSAIADWIARWRLAVPGYFAEPQLCEQLHARPIAIPQRAPEQVLERLAGIRELAGADLMLHEVASRQFWGLSKVLNGHQETIALLLGLDVCPFPDKPVQLLVAGRGHEADAPILFVENAATFESLASGSLALADGFVLIYASGYKASARRLRRPAGSSVYLAPDAFGGRHELIQGFLGWLCSDDVARPVHFWGDLDFAGMDILRQLRAVFPAAQAWKPGYEALLARLEANESHAPEEAKKAGQEDPGTTGCQYADEVLLPALRLRGRFVDQEAV